MIPFFGYRAGERWWRAGIGFAYVPAIIAVVSVELWMRADAAVIFDVRRDLGHPASFEPDADGAHGREPFGTGLADLRRDLLGLGQVRGRRKLDVEGDERWAGGDERGSGRGVRPRRSEVGHELAGDRRAGYRLLDEGCEPVVDTEEAVSRCGPRRLDERQAEAA